MSDELLKQLGLYVYILLFTKKKRNIKKEKGEAERIQHLPHRWEVERKR
jgi:hypothetical protein